MRVADQDVARSGCLFIVSGPSGAGKTSICTPALARLESIELSISVTTRAPRVGETDGVDYRFVSEERFEAMARSGAFAESAHVHGYRYGTPRSPIEERLTAGEDILLDIDVQGSRQIKAAYSDAVSIFLLPPSREGLERRLTERGTDDAAAVRERLGNACHEIAALPEYDYAIVNDDLDVAVEEFLAIVHAERARLLRVRDEDLSAVVRSFEVKS